MDRSDEEERAIRNLLAKQFGVASLDLDAFEVSAEVIRLVPKEAALQHLVVPVNRVGSTLVLAMADTRNLIAISAIGSITGCVIEVVKSEETAIRRALARYY